MLHMDSHRPSERKYPARQESHDRAPFPAGSAETGGSGGRGEPDRAVQRSPAPPNACFHGRWVRKGPLLPVSLIALEPIVLVPVVRTDDNHGGRV